MNTVRLPTTVRRVPVYGLRADPAGPRVVVLRMDRADHPIPHGDHTHDFFALTYIAEAEPGSPGTAGDLLVVAPGDLVGARALGLPEHGLRGVVGWTVMFDADVLGAQPAASPLAWGTHPLLAPFVGGHRGGIARLVVPESARPRWADRISALEEELRARRGGHHAAAAAHLTLLLVDVARLGDRADGGDVLADLQLNREPLLGEVFSVIERRFAEPLSLRDVAAAVGMSPGHLTTRVRERTGRTVLEWITERRMLEARRLLATTDEPVGAVAAAVGIADPGYFARVFRRAHGVSPASWRGRRGQAGRMAAISAAASGP
ncbi:helix-turn-helix transcriptional regulator [Pseudonocardia sp. CA-107938]|uniref:helix-turn-helix transcriptional regulator n=1 Tax=Pseudonocardia sp. CA-107938 TaxID=3240021 RepID=UPI003D8EAD25